MKTVLMKMNNAMARKMLRANSSDNRALRPRVVEALKAAWQRGEYVTSHQGIAFDTNEKLADGQHRLTALADMPDAFEIDMLVTYGVEPKAAKVMDIGVRRTAADSLHESRDVVEVARFLAIIFLGHHSGITPQFLVPFVDEVRVPLMELLADTPRKVKVFSSAPFRAAVIVTQLNGGDFDYAKLVYRSMVMGDFDLMPRSGRALYRAVVGGRVKTERPHDTFARALKIMDPKAADLVKVQISDQEKKVATVRELLQKKFGSAVETVTPAAPRGRAKRSQLRAERTHTHHVHG